MTEMELLDKIVKECGASGESTGTRTKAFIEKMLAEYSEKLGIDQPALLAAFEKRRNYYAPNYYQESVFPSMDQVRIFETEADLLAAMPSKQFVCPSCKSISTDPYQCNSGAEMAPGLICNWKAYGLFRTFGKGFRFTIREGFIDRPVIDEIFMPVEMLERIKVEDAEEGARDR